jgi:hypothetical protein
VSGWVPPNRATTHIFMNSPYCSGVTRLPSDMVPVRGIEEVTKFQRMPLRKRNQRTGLDCREAACGLSKWREEKEIAASHLRSSRTRQLGLDPRRARNT